MRLEKQETEGQINDLLPYLQDLVQKLNEIVFDGLGFEWMKVSNPFVDIQTRSS